MKQLQPFDERYLRLVLHLDKQIEGYIDAYLGPTELAEEVKREPKKEPAALLEDLVWLREQMPAEDHARHTFLLAALRAIETSIRLLAGEPIDYLDQVQRIYDIQPLLVPERHFEAAHKELEDLLPGTGDLGERAEHFRRHYDVPEEHAMTLLHLACAEVRRRTVQRIELPAGEGIELQLVQDQPWGAYNWYKGNGRSLVEFNSDMPLSALTMLDTMAHEGYPGHHTEAVLKERKFVHEKGYGEMAAALLHSPSAVIAEGIATTAAEIIFPEASQYDWAITNLLPAAGITPQHTAAQMARIQEALMTLRYARGNAAVRYHDGDFNREQTIDYIRTYGLASKERATKSFSFIAHPLYGSYIFTYTVGYDALAAAAGGSDKFDVFKRCLTEQVLPSTLAREAI